MNSVLKAILILFILLLINSCKTHKHQSKPVSASINKIMPLGASRVEGERPEFESYRYELWKELIKDGWTFDFIGTQEDEASYPIFNGDNFDVDHEGRGGWTSGMILKELSCWLKQTGAPDIVLFSSPGGNDALQNLNYSQTISNINAIIDTLQAVNPNVTIIIEQLAPARSELMTTELTVYINKLQNDVSKIASEQSTPSSKVIAVDMFTGFTDDFIADDVHYNEAGSVFIASRYYNVLVKVLEEE